MFTPYIHLPALTVQYVKLMYTKTKVLLLSNCNPKW